MPVILMTAYGTPEITTGALAFGAWRGIIRELRYAVVGRCPLQKGTRYRIEKFQLEKSGA